MTLLDHTPGTSKYASLVAPGVFRIPTSISNAYFVTLSTGEYVLIDSGCHGHAKNILQAALDLFESAPPAAILLTHAHFDHAGGLPELLRYWPEIPIFAHTLELPYLNDGVHYPPGDPTVGGVMAEMFRFIDTTRPTKLPIAVQAFPDAAELDLMPGWELRPSPGHTPGHVSFWNPADRTLIAGDAIVTFNSNNPIAALTSRVVISPPPPYATYNWHHARQSARRPLAELQPLHLAPGHGIPTSSHDLPQKLHQFAAHFPTPKRGRYVHTAARFNREGPTFIPPPAPDYIKYVTFTAASVLLGAAIYALARPGKNSDKSRPIA